MNSSPWTIFHRKKWGRRRGKKERGSVRKRKNTERGKNRRRGKEIKQKRCVWNITVLASTSLVSRSGLFYAAWEICFLLYQHTMLLFYKRVSLCYYLLIIRSFSNWMLLRRVWTKPEKTPKILLWVFHKVLYFIYGNSMSEVKNRYWYTSIIYSQLFTKIIFTYATEYYCIILFFSQTFSASIHHNGKKKGWPHQTILRYRKAFSCWLIYPKSAF